MIKTKELEIDVARCEAYIYRVIKGQVKILKIDGKAIGIFGDTELQWHANGTARHIFDEICVSLYCVEECVDTVLSICNQCDAFVDLSEWDKLRYRSIDIQLDNKKDAIYKISEHDLPDNPAPENEMRTGADFYKEDVDRRPLVGKHPIDGREYLYFMVPFIVGAFNGDIKIITSCLSIVI